MGHQLKYQDYIDATTGTSAFFGPDAADQGWKVDFNGAYSWESTYVIRQDWEEGAAMLKAGVNIQKHQYYHARSTNVVTGLQTKDFTLLKLNPKKAPN